MASITGCNVKVQVDKGVMSIRLVDNVDEKPIHVVSARIGDRLVTDVQKQLTDELFNKLIVPGRFNN